MGMQTTNLGMTAGKLDRPMADKRKKRWAREHRDKRGSWKCHYCHERHANGTSCPVPRKFGPEVDVTLFRLGIK